MVGWHAASLLLLEGECMRSRTEMACHLLDYAYHVMVRHFDDMTLEEALSWKQQQ